MLKRGKLALFVAGALLLVISWACGFSAGIPANSLAPTVDLNQLSGTSGNTSEPTEASLTTAPFVILATPTEELPSESAPVAPPPAIPESRRLTLEYPPEIRVGDSDVIRLTLEVDTLGNLTPTAEGQGNTVTGKIVQIPNVYDTHNVFAEARIDIAGLNIQPADIQSESLTQGQAVTFYWSVQPTSAGTF